MSRANTSSRLWWACLVVTGIVSVGYYTIATAYQDFLYDAFVFFIAGVILAGVRWHRPEPRLPWFLIAGGLYLTGIGESIWTYEFRVTGEEPFPSFADAFLLAGTLSVAAALLAFVRYRSPGIDIGAFTDATILSIGAGLIAWVFLMEPFTLDTSLTAFGRAVAIAYPVVDVLMLGLLARLLLVPGARSRSLDLIVYSTIALLAADSIFGYLQFSSAYSDGAAVDFLWMVQFGQLGAAALHPSMVTLTSRLDTPPQALTSRRLVLLAAATLLSPVSLIAQWLLDQPLNVPLIALGSGTLFLLVLWRMNTLVHSHRRSEARERELRRAGVKLATANGRDEILEIARAAAWDLLSGRARSVCIHVGTVGSAPATGGWTLQAWESLLTRFEENRRPIELTAEIEPELARIAGVEGPRLRALYVPLVYRPDHTGVIAVAAPVFDTGVKDSLQSLASHVAVALESSVLAEEVHRRRSDTRFRALVQQATDAIVIVDSAGDVRFASPAISRITGFSVEELTGQNVEHVVHPQDRFGLLRVLQGTSDPDESSELEVRVLDRAGDWRWCIATGNDRTDDPEIEGIILTLRDVTERKALEDQLRHQAFHDALTGLPNRTLFYDRLSHGLARAGRSASALSVLFIDVDGFKMVNDERGHATGDQFLTALAARFVQSLRPGDTVARLGGDEFAVLLEDATSDIASAMADRIMVQVTRPLVINGGECPVSISIGIASRTGPETTADDLIRQADVAMYSAKRQGKSRAIAFDPTMTERVWKRMVIEADLNQGLAGNQFEVFYQPIVELVHHQIVEVEALVRWNHPQKGLITPAEFIPIAEETGLIVPIGLWVLERACRDVLAWRDQSQLDQLSLSVNLSPAMLHQDNIAEKIGEILDSTGYPPEALKLEITEGVMMHDDQETIEQLRALKRLGVRLAIDDFGTGYSSLAYLRAFPIDVIKIDRSFVAALTENLESLAIVRMIIGLARSLNLEVTGEGIETSVQLSQLQALGSDLGQGFIFSEPLPAGQLSMLLNAPHAPAGFVPV